MGSPPRALLAGGLGIAASFLVACGGSSGLLSGSQADNLNTQLNQVQQAVNAQNCGAARSAAASFSSAVDSLPASVNQTLVSNLRQGATTVSQLAAKDCTSQTTTTSTSTSPTTTSSTSTSTSTSSSTPTSSSTSTTTSTPTTSSATSSTSSGTSSTSGSGGVGLGGTGTAGGGGAGAGTGGGNP